VFLLKSGTQVTSGTFFTNTSKSWNSTTGNLAAGSAEGNLGFDDFNEAVSLGVNFTGDWTGKTKLHASVMVDTAASDLGYLYQVQFGINTTNSYTYTHHDYLASTFTKGVWKTVDLDFAVDGGTSAAPTLAQMKAIAVFTFTNGSGTTPVQTQVYLDDVWYE